MKKFLVFIFFLDIFKGGSWVTARWYKKVQKNFLMGLKIWWSWGSRFFFSKSHEVGRFFDRESEVKKWSNFWVFDLYETFICLRAYLEQKPNRGKNVQKNFLMGLKLWWSWGSRFFFSKSQYSVRFLDFHLKL